MFVPHLLPEQRGEHGDCSREEGHVTHLRKAILARVVLFVALTLGGCVLLVSVDITGEWT